MNFKEYLKSKNACAEAVEWAGDKTLEEVWATCKRPDWMLWLCERNIGRSGWPDKKALVLMACAFARSVLHLVPDGEDRPRLAIEAAERCAENDTQENRAAAWAAALAAARVAGDAARAAAGAAWAAGAAVGAAARAAAGAARAARAARAAGAAVDASWAAVDAARAASWAAGDAAWSAVDAAVDAAWSAVDAARAAARVAAEAAQSDMIRKIWPSVTEPWGGGE